MLESLFARFPSFGAAGVGVYKPGLERMAQMCSRMGNPQEKLPLCIHVAGTNGKGSTCNMIAAHLAASGRRTLLYTSPHILDYRERIRVIEKGAEDCVSTLISREEVWDFINRYREDFDILDLSLFEITTAMMLEFAVSRKVDAAVIETGLGGRLDATNVITPSLSVITNIGYDHMDLLGQTLPDIAAEKAGIIKPGVPVVIGESSPETDPVFERVAASCGAPIHFADRQGPGGLPDAIASPAEGLDLKGIYQAKNLNTVCCALRTLGMEPDMRAIASAAAICDFHGRWEKICGDPYTICDIGHNEHGLKYNFRQLDTLLDSGAFTDLVMVYGSVSDKDVDAVLRILPRRAVIFFTAAANRRAMPADELFRRAAHQGGTVVDGVANAVSQAIDLCRTMARPLLYIGGSTYIVSEALPIFTERK